MPLFTTEEKARGCAHIISIYLYFKQYIQSQNSNVLGFFVGCMGLKNDFYTLACLKGRQGVFPASFGFKKGRI